MSWCIVGHYHDGRVTRGLCDRHYGSLVRRGNPPPPGVNIPPPNDDTAHPAYLCDCGPEATTEPIALFNDGNVCPPWRACTTCKRPRREDLAGAVT